MNPQEFLKGIYYGDCGCKNIIIDCWGGHLKIQVDTLFLMKGDLFDYESDREVVDGYIVFEGVDKIYFSGGGFPNDSLNSIVCSDEVLESGKWNFVINVDSIDESFNVSQVLIHLTASSVYIQELET